MLNPEDKLLDFLQYHIHAADDHYIRWKWAVGSVAMWDNRYAWLLESIQNSILILIFKMYRPSGYSRHIRGSEARCPDNSLWREA